MNAVTAPVLVALLLLLPVSASAIDHTNLDEGRPVRVEDAYAIPTGEIAVETGAGVTLRHHGGNRGFFPIEFWYGALANFQIGIGTTLSTNPHEIEEPPKAGDVRIGALYNLNQETLSMPAFGMRVDVEVPTGVDAKGVDIAVKGIVTKSFERLTLHLNAGYEFVTASGRDERDGRYTLAIGGSYPLGAPLFTRATLVGDVFAEQSLRRRDSTTVGAELGGRYQLTPRMVWDVGVGTEFAGPGDRSTFSFTTGLSFGF